VLNLTIPDIEMPNKDIKADDTIYSQMLNVVPE
jgi:hypothetical protein